MFIIFTISQGHGGFGGFGGRGGEKQKTNNKRINLVIFHFNMVYLGYHG